MTTCMNIPPLLPALLLPPGPGGQSSFLQKRMAKNAKFFDSGDYQVCYKDSR